MQVQPTWDEAFSCYSDMYKDVNGFRPRGRHLRELTVDDLGELCDRLAEHMAEAIAESEAEMAWLDEQLAAEAAEQAAQPEPEEVLTQPAQRGANVEKMNWQAAAERDSFYNYNRQATGWKRCTKRRKQWAR